MLKNMTYKEKFEILAPWLPNMLEAIKKDIRQEHLQKDRNFAKLYFPGQSVQKIPIKELAPAYQTALLKDGGEQLGEFIAVRWILKHSDVYHFFEKHLKEIDPKFEELEILDDEKALKLLQGAVATFGALTTYLFSVINSVVFSEKIYHDLKSQVDEEKVNHENISESQNDSSAPSLETLVKNHEQLLKKITDKYEKKLSGLQSKYLQDTNNLKKQIGALQKKLHSLLSENVQ